MDLGAQLRAAESTLAALHLELDQLQTRVSVEEERVSLLRRLLELESPNTSTKNDSSLHAAPSILTNERRVRRKLVTLEDAVVQLLGEKNEAVHIGEIHSELIKRGVRIPGKGVDANIISRIMKEPRIEREAGRRGYYRLA